jgi:2-phosphoglycerate kinase
LGKGLGIEALYGFLSQIPLFLRQNKNHQNLSKLFLMQQLLTISGYTPTWRYNHQSGRYYLRRMLTKGHEKTDGSAPLREQLRHIYWLGGGSGAGKSTIAHRLAAQHGLHIYSTDDVMPDHARRSTSEDSPLLYSFMAMDMDERWVSRSPKAMLETFHWFQGEGFRLIIEDLLRFPLEPGVIVEGFRLLPRLVKPLVSVPAQSVWLLPTPAFRQTVFESRGGSASGFLARTSDPERALRNLLERDRMFTDTLREETTRLEMSAIEVDAAMTEDDLAGRVTELFGLGHAA